MSKRAFLDFGDMLGQGLEVFSEAFGYDVYGTQTKFPAIVLSPPVPMTAGQAGLFTKANRPASPLRNEELYAGKDAALNKLDKFFFRARILGPNSPHDFLPDPCSPDASSFSPLASQADATFKLISMHTLFVSSDDYQLGTGAVFPTKGSIVLVELEHNQFGYNLESGRFLKVLSKTNPYYNVENMLRENCIHMGLGSDFSGTTLGGLNAPQEIIYNGAHGTNIVFKNGSPPGEIVERINTAYSMRGVILLKDAAADFNKMAQAYLKEKGYKLGITDGLRSYETQVQTMIDKPEKAATPGTSDHGTGVAVDLAADGTTDKAIEFGSETFKWLSANAPKYGWIHPHWAHEGGSRPEPWHWEWKDKGTVLSVSQPTS